MAMGIESLLVCSLLILRGLQKWRKVKIAVKSATFRHDVWSTAREASAAPAALFKRRYRKLRQPSVISRGMAQRASAWN
jgi:hypothetical protein